MVTIGDQVRRRDYEDPALRKIADTVLEEINPDIDYEVDDTKESASLTRHQSDCPTRYYAGTASCPFGCKPEAYVYKTLEIGDFAGRRTAL